MITHIFINCLLNHTPISHAVLVFRYYKAGVVVLFLHDICDVVLEFTKLCICMKIRDKKHYYMFEVLTNIGFLLFAFSW